MNLFEIKVLLDCGVVYRYDVTTPEQVKEHCQAIATTGFRFSEADVYTHIPAHRIVKVTATPGIADQYPVKPNGVPNVEKT